VDAELKDCIGENRSKGVIKTPALI
jgi:hypothetical protein